MSDAATPHIDARCRRLWVAILLQAVTDALYDGRNPDLLAERESARRWVNTTTGDFRFVCDMAGFHPSWISRQLRQAIARWVLPRAANGTGKRFLERQIYRMKQKQKKSLN